jgi:hypothetical protein
MFKYTTVLLKDLSNVSQLRSAKLLPSFLHEVAIGQLLGDASCFGSSPTSHSRMEWSFGKDREDYAKWINSLFTDYIGTPLSSRMVSSRADNPAKTVSYRLKTLSLPVFNYYRHLFYVWNEGLAKYVKVIPAPIGELLTPVVLAHLVMGDGNYQGDAKTIRVYTNGFTEEELKMFAKAIQAKYSIDVGVRHDRKGQYILIIGPSQLIKFQSLVSKHFHSSLLYRIGL